MPSIINSDDGVSSGSSGLKTTGGNDGITTFQQNGTERMRIDSSGNVGIGTNTPSSFDAKLALFNGNLALTTTTNKLYLYYASATNFAHVSTAVDGSITLTNGTTSPVERMRIDPSGNVEIKGTATQAGTLRLYEETDNGTNYVSVAAPLSVASNVALTLPTAAGMLSGAPTTETYDTGTTVTWTKPSQANWLQIEMWGGGGSGGKGASNAPGGGGGGGAYVSYVFKFSDLVGTVVYSVGAGATGQTTASTAGNIGGTTTVVLNSFAGGANKTITVFGGGGGAFAATGGGGGGGGGVLSAGTTGAAGAAGVGGDPNAGNPGASCPATAPSASTYGGGRGGVANGTATANTAGGGSLFGGAGGGGGIDGTGSATVNKGGDSIWGGAGGGGAANTTAGGNGGTSTFGGNGSAGVIDANISAAGTTPGGGSGGTEGGNSGAGGSGRVRFTYW